MAFRKYPPLTRPLRKVQMLASQGTVLPGSVIPRRRLGLYHPTSKVQQLGSLGAAAAGTFQSAWARGANVILQSGLR